MTLGLSVAGSECGAMDSDDRWGMSEVKTELETEGAEESPVCKVCKIEKDDRGQWHAVAPFEYMIPTIYITLNTDIVTF